MENRQTKTNKNKLKFMPLILDVITRLCAVSFIRTHHRWNNNENKQSEKYHGKNHEQYLEKYFINPTEFKPGHNDDLDKWF